MRLGWARASGAGGRFQSSSSMKAGCDLELVSEERGFDEFQSSSGMKPDATGVILAVLLFLRLFQSSSGREAGCNA